MNTNSTETPTSVDFLEQLRSATSTLHIQLENLPISKAIISPDISLNVYGKYLNLMLDVTRDMETVVYPVLSKSIDDIDDRRKQQLILNDLNAIGFEASASPTLINGGYSMPFALGIMYVVEGSTLGGRYILKNVEKFLALDSENGASYFAGYGHQTGSTWKNFLKVLLNYEEANQCTDEIIAGAQFAFGAIHKHLLNT